MSEFSVLLSLYYKEDPAFLYQSLDSIFNQTLPPGEVVLVKDGPLTDELEQVIEEYRRKISILKIIPLAVNQGLGKALNEGLKHCSYPLVARMDTDDVAKADRFEKQIEIFCTHPEVDVVGSWIDEFEGSIENVVSVRMLPETHEEILKYARLRCPVNHPTVMFRKEAVLNVGGYVHFFLFEDYYLWIRMLMNGACFYNIPQSLLYFRFSSEMFRRRGGWKYAWSEFWFQRELWRQGFIGFFRFVLNVCIRFLARIIPNSLRVLLYKKVLRRL